MCCTWARIFWRSACWEWRFFARQPMERLLLFWLPAFSILFVWYTFSQAQVRDLPIGIYNQDHSSLSRQLERFIDASPNVAINVHYRDILEAKRALETGEVFAVVVIPNDFSARIKQTQVSPAVLNVNAQFGTHSGIVQSGVSAAVRTFSAGIERNRREKMGISKAQATANLIPLRPTATMAFNLSLNYQIFLASNIVPALLHILATVVGVGTIGRELRQKTLGHWFRGACGTDRKNSVGFFAMLSALIGKVFWQMLIFSFWGILILLLISKKQTISTTSLAITVLDQWLMIILSLWLGIILSALTMSYRMGLSFAGFITAPAFAYSGVTFPVAAMPTGAQVISALLPLTYYLQVQAVQMQMQQPWQAALPVTYVFILVIVGMALAATGLAIIALKRKSAWGKR